MQQQTPGRKSGIAVWFWWNQRHYNDYNALWMHIVLLSGMNSDEIWVRPVSRNWPRPDGMMVVMSHSANGFSMCLRKLQPNLASYLCSLGALREAKQWQLAIHWLRRWFSRGAEPWGSEALTNTNHKYLRGFGFGGVSLYSFEKTRLGCYPSFWRSFYSFCFASKKWNTAIKTSRFEIRSSDVRRIRDISSVPSSSWANHIKLRSWA